MGTDVPLASGTIRAARRRGRGGPGLGRSIASRESWAAPPAGPTRALSRRSAAPAFWFTLARRKARQRMCPAERPPAAPARAGAAKGACETTPGRNRHNPVE